MENLKKMEGEKEFFWAFKFGPKGIIHRKKEEENKNNCGWDCLCRDEAWVSLPFEYKVERTGRTVTGNIDFDSCDPSRRHIIVYMKDCKKDDLTRGERHEIYRLVREKVRNFGRKDKWAF